ncbi:monofunctional biosynthetic peptidoglycan transglycosylase [Bizionia saleffrena]|uniref:Biosynthetic peptidoglycan transglycosylase n=1 Tax=Bizionia saleffrena TaxID=291189 RepID=A0A8H2QEE6_9FLAO|nr:monofunctional biosynthetic peptidoglycan transglycosylase [Bizionia saleffrena]TYB74128.1 monofunctional biosynthetic peptidoglycan transglycosylase [Bizionia saleffrena]
MKRIFRFFLKLIFWCFVVSIASVVLYKFVPVPATPLMVIRYFENEETNRTLWKHDWVPMEAISKKLQLAVICSEDQNFLNHNGFDIKAIGKAFERNQKGKQSRGASSISQQTAKNVFLWPQRTWVRKGFEVYFTFLIEIIWSKERILEVYLNSIEMGDGIYGAEAAANYWFKKSAAKLTTYEAAAIASILPSPLRYRAHPASTYIQGRKNWIVKQMGYFGRLEFKTDNESK